jgi:hypothetical protein
LLVGVLALMAVVWSVMIRWSIRRSGAESPVIALQRMQQAGAAAANKD